MAETAAPAKRWILVKQLHHAVERAEHEIAELKAHGLFVRDATGPDDSHDAPQPAGTPAVPGAGTTPPPALSPAGAKPDTTKET